MIRASENAVPYQTAFSNGTHTAVADVPMEKGGAGQGFGPHELLEAALATCLTMTVRMAAEHLGIPLAGTAARYESTARCRARSPCTTTFPSTAR